MMTRKIFFHRYLDKIYNYNRIRKTNVMIKIGADLHPLNKDCQIKETNKREECINMATE
jgi:hypothetical protein